MEDPFEGRGLLLTAARDISHVSPSRVCSGLTGRGSGGPAGEEDLDGLDRPIQEAGVGVQGADPGMGGRGEEWKTQPPLDFSFPLKWGFLLNSQPLTDGDCSSLSEFLEERETFGVYFCFCFSI